MSGLGTNELPSPGGNGVAAAMGGGETWTRWYLQIRSGEASGFIDCGKTEVRLEELLSSCWDLC